MKHAEPTATHPDLAALDEHQRRLVREIRDLIAADPAARAVPVDELDQEELNQGAHQEAAR